jgi:hypothetical protein
VLQLCLSLKEPSFLGFWAAVRKLFSLKTVSKGLTGEKTIQLHHIKLRLKTQLEYHPDKWLCHTRKSVFSRIAAWTRGEKNGECVEMDWWWQFALMLLWPETIFFPIFVCRTNWKRGKRIEKAFLILKKSASVDAIKLRVFSCYYMLLGCSLK